ncbi:disease resistance protein Piks-1-like [Phragmites australis]|uniref:disease resistance protein Piks-1-like n=1 Tax=Phragmites australis TaxID=29695 RepID=UPI002D783F80|nr:disease resistance protein Piks-1-like [Phragmites australis]
MKQKIVIKVQMTCDKCRSKAMALVAAASGVDSVAIAGDDKDQVVVVGDGVDSIKLTSALRKKVGPAQLVQVGDAKKDDAKKPPAAAVPQYMSNPWYYHYPAPQPPVSVVYEHPAGGYGYGYGYQTPPDSNCSIM